MERCPMQRSAQRNSGSFNLAYKQNWIMSMLGKLRGVLLNIFHQSDCSDNLKTLHENKNTPPFLSYTTTLQLSPHFHEQATSLDVIWAVSSCQEKI